MATTGYSTAQINFRTSVLQRLGADKEVTNALLAYCSRQSGFSSDFLNKNTLPLPDEKFVQCWRQYLRISQATDPVSALQKPLVQLNFPLYAGISKNKDYTNVTKRMHATETSALATGHQFTEPNKITIALYASIAGHIPVIMFANRQDFEYAWQALLNRNEPAQVPPGLGAGMVASYNNIDRIRQHKDNFLRDNKAANWPAELNKLLSCTDLFQDKFILISPGPYSNISAEELGLDLLAWLHTSIEIRIHHELAHYITRRVCGSMANHLQDELIADYLGIRNTIGTYRADWFLRFLGIDDGARYRSDGRIMQYLENIEVGSKAFEVAVQLMINGAKNLEKADNSIDSQGLDYSSTEVALALTTLTLEELASSEGFELLIAQVNHVSKLKGDSTCTTEHHTEQ